METSSSMEAMGFLDWDRAQQFYGQKVAPSVSNVLDKL
jgi:hypothetical protein